MKDGIAKVSPVAKHIITKCGGAKRAAELTGRHWSSIYKWTYPREQGGTGGLVPAEAQAELMGAARRGEVDLTPADFFEDA